MQSLIEWVRMDGYGGYVWSVLALLILVVCYEVWRLKTAEGRSQSIYSSLQDPSYQQSNKSEI